ncbi:MAG TPA: phage tail sheath subtilisin-like domain-containing protein, partial [Rubrobacter sp.]|nr:phage tail sheath subtilisin-like domain-containing protein [Rubrobacter sp.]
MTEMVVPGTYITVRAEGLISAGRVATGIVGVIGTAANGPIGVPITLSGLTDARARFGLSDSFDRPEDGANPLTLFRALEHIYSNGAASVMAVRVAGSSQSSATFAVQDADGLSVAVLGAQTPGTWANNIRIQIDTAEDPCRVEDETHTEDFDQLGYGSIRPSPENRIRITRGATRRTETPDIVYKRVISDEEVVRRNNRFFLASVDADTLVVEVPDINVVRVLDADGEVVREYGDGDILYGAGGAPGAGEVRVDNATGELTFEASEVPTGTQTVVATYALDHADPQSGEVLVTTWDGSLDFAEDEAPDEAEGDTLVASYLIEADACAQVTLTYGAVIERYTVPDGNLLAWQVNRSSSLISAEADDNKGGNLPQTGVDAYFGTGVNVPGSNGAEAGRDEYTLGLEALADRLVNIVVLAGQDAGTMGSALLGHLNSTEQADYERIGVIGAPGDSTADFLGHSMADDRVILVAPGLRDPDGTELPPAYTAAAVAGLISSFPVQTSLTNKPLNVPGLATRFNRGEQGQLIRRNVLAVVERDGFRVLKGVTTEGEGAPFSAIPTRRIVDYAKY